MQTIGMTVWVVVTNRVRELRERGSERGLTTTEVAVLTFILVAIAVVIGGLLYNYARDTVDNAPDSGDLTPTIPDA